MTNSARKVFVALTALVLVMTSVSAFAQRDDGEKKTKETVAMSQPVYEALVEIQELVETLPAVQERRVAIDGPAGTLGASLILPEGSGPFPGVVFLHGSGPQPRDASRWAAQALAEARQRRAALERAREAEGEAVLREPSASLELASRLVRVLEQGEQ